MTHFKSILRKIIRPFFLFIYSFKKANLNRDHRGNPLQPGITAVISMKDEEYTIALSIKSLLGIADQIICIDNGSEDESVNIVKNLIVELNGLIEIELHEMPNALLGDCRNFGLSRSKHQWHLRWDADMISIKSGLNDMRYLRQLIHQQKSPAAIQFGYINLNGDFNHTVIDHERSLGEPYLVFFNKDIFYQEIDKFDVIKLPKYFSIISTNRHLFFHCGGLKSDKNLIHRFHYFTWRKFTINDPKFNLSKEEFIRKRNLFLLNTTEDNNVKFRYQKQNVFRFIKYDVDNEVPFTEEILNLLRSEGKRFEVIYNNGRPVSRRDYNDQEMNQFIPKEEDLNWDANIFFEKLKNESPSQYLD